MKHIFIVNPTSGKGHSLEFVPIIEDYFKKNKGDYQIVMTEYVHHATELANEYSKQQDVVLYSVGGDGTMKEILDGIDEKVILCVIPAGTGNDFYKSIDLRKVDKKQLLADCIEGEVVKVDYGILNGKSKFLNVCSFGLDADVNDYACNYVKVQTKIPNSLVYAYSAIKVGLHPSPFYVEGQIDGIEFKKEIIVLACSNGRYYGGMFMPAPLAELNDGLLNLCLVGKIKRKTRLIKLLWEYSKGKHINEPECLIKEAKTMHFKFDREVNYQIDGENGRLQECYIEIKPQAMKIKMPIERRKENEK